MFRGLILEDAVLGLNIKQFAPLYIMDPSKDMFTFC